MKQFFQRFKLQWIGLALMLGLSIPILAIADISYGGFVRDLSTPFPGYLDVNCKIGCGSGAGATPIPYPTSTPGGVLKTMLTDATGSQVITFDAHGDPQFALVDSLSSNQPRVIAGGSPTGSGAYGLQVLSQMQAVSQGGATYAKEYPLVASCVDNVVTTNTNGPGQVTCPLDVTAGGLNTAIVAAGVGTTIIKAASGRVIRALITTAGTSGDATIYDNASACSGTIIGIVDGTTDIPGNVKGATQIFDMPAANGIAACGAAGSPAFTLSYN